MAVPVLDLRKKSPRGAVLTRVTVRKSQPLVKGFKSKPWCVSVKTATMPAPGFYYYRTKKEAIQAAHKSIA